jgi:Uma2 family endonuclease
MSTTITQKEPTADNVPEEPLFRLNLAQYHDMIRFGILTEDDPVELLQGYLVNKMPKNPPHSLVTQQTRDELDKILPSGWFLNVQEPVTTEDSEPEPDITAVRGSRRQFRERHPGPGDVGLLVEVADTSLRRDRGSKKKIYAQARIPVYWIINLVEQTIEVYTDPGGSGRRADYQQRQDFSLGKKIPVVLDGKVVARLAVRELLC